MISDKMLSTTVNVERKTLAQDDYGQAINIYSSYITGMQCAFQGRSGSDSIVSSQEKYRFNYKLYCRSTESLDYVTDRFIHGSNYYYPIFYNANYRGNHIEIELRLGSSDYNS